MRLALTHDDGTVIASVKVGPARWIDANVDSHDARELLNEVDAAIPGGNPLTAISTDECEVCGTPIKEVHREDEFTGERETVWMDRSDDHYAVEGLEERFHYHRPKKRETA